MCVSLHWTTVVSFQIKKKVKRKADRSINTKDRITSTMDPEGMEHTIGKEEKEEVMMMMNETKTKKKFITGSAVWSYRKPIFTAIVIPKKDATTSMDDDETLALLDCDDDSIDNETPLNRNKAAAGQPLSSETEEDSVVDKDGSLLAPMYNFSLVFGFLVGCFIQSSSLGANYILMVAFGRDHHEMSKHPMGIIAFSLAWSFLTSFMGIIVLLILRSLVCLAAEGLNKNNLLAGRPTVFCKTHLSLVAFLEFPFAFGALAGVCTAWAATDLVLGLRCHAYHSIVTLVVAYGGKRVFQAFTYDSSLTSEDRDDFSDDEDSISVIKKPLLEDASKNADEKVSKIDQEFKVKGTATGLLVGFFIQFSSLGASFLIDALLNGNNNSAVPVSLSRERLVVFSLGWSFVFGTMGVAILLLFRYLVGLVCDHILSRNQGSEEEIEEEAEMAERWAVSLEFFFAVGCLVGVNLAWLITDVGLGLNALVWRSLATLAVAAAWCLLLAYCFGFSSILYHQSDDSGHRQGRHGVKMVTKATQTTKEGLLLV